MRNLLWLTGILASFSACSARPPPVDQGPPGRPAHELPSFGPASVTRAPNDAPPAQASGGPSAPPSAGPLLADESTPRGVDALSREEREELSRDCKRISDRIGHKASEDHREKSFRAYVDEVLDAAPASLVGVPDVGRCKALIRRDARAQEAAVIELEANESLHRIGASMSVAREKGSPCGNAGPVPADLAAVKNTLYVPKTGDFAEPGWKCLFFDIKAPMRWQYEVRVAPGGDAYDATAKGFPVVEADTPEELYIHVELVNGKWPVSPDVLRRR